MEYPLEAPARALDRLDVVQLVSYLRSAARTRPVVILTVARGSHAPHVDPAVLEREFGRQVDIVTLPTEAATHALSETLTDREASVYGGACRVYPPGELWETEPRRNPLRMARTAEERGALPERLRRDINAALRPVPPQPSTPGAAGRTAVRPAAPSAPRAPVRPPSGEGFEVSTAARADELAAYLLSAARDRPVLVVTRAAGTHRPYVDVDVLRSDLAGLADVFEISTAAASWAFSEAVPDRCQVYGGASRVYPVGRDWIEDPYSSPLRFAFGPADGPDVARALTSDAMTMAARHGASLPGAAELPRPVTGEISGIVAGRALVQLDDGQVGVIWPELVVPGPIAERVFHKGMRIEGVLDPDSRRIDVSGMRRDPEEALAAYQPGDTVLTRITAVRRDGCTVELFPGVTQDISADNLVRDDTDVRQLMVEGEVLRLWFADRYDGEWVLSLLEAAPEDEVVPAPALLRGGPPWLVLPALTTPPAPLLAEQVSSPEEPDVTDEDALSLVQELRRETAQLSRTIRERDERIAALEERLAKGRARLRDAARRVNSRWGLARLFESDEDQLDFEVRTAWALMTTPSEKQTRPLRPWTYGPAFFDTLARVQGIKRDKIIEVIVHVLTGRDAELASRELHQLRTGAGGDDAPVSRRGGETCWRVSLQVGTPSARRLHYWQRNDGSIELSSIRLHDDFRP